MSKTAVVTTRVPDEVMERLDRLAGAMERSRAWLIAKAIERYVDEELEFIDFVRVGEQDVAAGRVLSQEEVEARFLGRKDERSAA